MASQESPQLPASTGTPDTSRPSTGPKGPHSPRGPRATAEELAAVFEAFDLDPADVRPLGQGGVGARFAVVGPAELIVARRFKDLDAELGEDAPFLLAIEGRPDDRRLAMWRNALWPLIHVGAVLRVKAGAARVQTIGTNEPVDGDFDAFEGAVLYGRRTSHVMSPAATALKFDRNARSWNGEAQAGKKLRGYAHFRWMRRHVGRLVRPAAPEGRPLRVLDFGCGAGWVGIEAASRVPGAELSAFDPSPEMVRIAEDNARANGVDRFTGRVGFGEDPPFGGPREDERYDLVISSGVVSFSPDVERWLDGLVATLAPGADLIVGDIHPTSKGFLRRRQRKPLLPVRELNARAREEIRAGLERRGLSHVRSGAYQLTRPIPEAMHVNETRLGGALTKPLLWLNQLATWLDGSFGSPLQDRFDSWVMHLRAPDGPPSD